MKVNQKELKAKRIYEKTIRLLDSSQTELRQMRSLLKKSINALALSSENDDTEQRDRILKGLANGFDKNSDLSVLDAMLDEIIVRSELSSELVVATAANEEAGGFVENDLNQMLIEFINRLSLQDDVKDKRQQLAEDLAYPITGFSAWADIINKMVEVINDSISSMEAEKQELQRFINKIIQQLADIEAYVSESRNESAETASQSAVLSESVNADVKNIQDSVSEATDIDVLKQNVQCYLDNIKNSVEENKRELELKEIRARESYDHMMDELSSTQRESERLKEQLQESHKQLLRDDLTGLPNRMAFNERMAAEYHRFVRSHTETSVAMWDIDNFKKFNDRYGHDVGDRVLKVVSNLIHTRIRKVDLFARYGGEEFVLLMPETDLASALSLCESLRIKLAEADFYYDKEECVITSSVGISCFRAGDTIEDVMKRADIALYQSKDAGRNCCTVSDPE